MTINAIERAVWRTRSKQVQQGKTRALDAMVMMHMTVNDTAPRFPNLLPVLKVSARNDAVRGGDWHAVHIGQAGKPSPNASSLPHVLRLVYNVLAKSQGPLSEQDVSSQLGGDRRAAFSPANVLITLRQLKDLNYVVEFSAPDTKAPAPGTAKGDQNVAGVAPLASARSLRPRRK